MKSILRRQMDWVQLDPARGSEKAKRRPCVVCSGSKPRRARRNVRLADTATKAGFMTRGGGRMNCVDAVDTIETR
jgi:mRNA-degrading endonuclease toxin of MazEF toxin-antitoxin module